MIEGLDGTRAGAFGLTLLADPLNIGILEALKEGPLALPDLRRFVGAPPQTTLRNRLKTFGEAGAVDRHQEPVFPGAVSYELTKAGKALNGTARILAMWLAAAPDQSLELGSPAAKGAIKALVGGWNSNMLRALAVKALSLTELDRLLTDINYPALERRLESMRLTGQVIPLAGNGTRPYGLTRWQRRSVASITAAIHWERLAKMKTPDLRRHDVETLFLLSTPLLRVPEAPDGPCRLEVKLTERAKLASAGVTITIASGKAVACRASVQEEVPNWASGTAAAWFDALEGRPTMGISVGGNAPLATALISAIRHILDPEVGSR
jgi:DNA-binding HxlR family transcriptional regulator